MRQIRKLARFIGIYGLRKTLFKVFGRLRIIQFGLSPKQGANIGVIGTGQFTFSTVGFALHLHYGNQFVTGFDIDEGNSNSFCKFYGLGKPSLSASEVIERKEVQYVYIASNHASHTDYALQVLAAGKIPYIEKPISVNFAQFGRLVAAVRATGLPVYAGYNRPFSQAVTLLKKYCMATCEPITLNCFISGHRLAPDHWYRRPEEGTRICGNVGHWLDLAVHILSWGKLPDRWLITLAYSNDSSRDDDMAIVLTSERGDLVNIVLTARSEPFEGINETINYQQGDVIAKIDDFRVMTIWKGDLLKRHRFWPKDVGHNLAIIQPFSGVSRNWQEVEFSTLLLLYIKEMVVAGEHMRKFSFAEIWLQLGLDDDKAFLDKS